jgi:DNA-directed RNA polymerase specialized sigma24 family protein
MPQIGFSEPMYASSNLNAQFTTTHWSVVLAAGSGSSPEAQAALGRLCQSYWYPIYAFVRRQGFNAHDSEDVVQGFLAHLLARPFLRGVACENGKFRSFLLASLRNFMADQRDKSSALKRGAGQPVISFDSEEAASLYASEPVNTLSPDKLLERRWAMTLLERAQARLKDEYAVAGKQQLFEKLRQFNATSEAAPLYRELATELDMPENTLKSLIHRMRQRYRQLLREEVAQTVSTAAEVDDEIRYLLQVASS